MRRNRRNAAAFQVEREYLRDLPEHRTTDFVEDEARVTRCGTFTVDNSLYSAPSRLIGHRLKPKFRPFCSPVDGGKCLSALINLSNERSILN